MLATRTTPQTLRDATLTAVREGAWTPSDVVATVATDSPTDRRVILATLWDLVDDGTLVYDAALRPAGFHIS